MSATQTTEVTSTFRRTPAYRYVRVADRLPIDIDRTKDLFEVLLRCASSTPRRRYMVAGVLQP